MTRRDHRQRARSTTAAAPRASRARASRRRRAATPRAAAARRGSAGSRPRARRGRRSPRNVDAGRLVVNYSPRDDPDRARRSARPPARPPTARAPGTARRRRRAPRRAAARTRSPPAARRRAPPAVPHRRAQPVDGVGEGDVAEAGEEHQQAIAVLAEEAEQRADHQVQRMLGRRLVGLERRQVAVRRSRGPRPGGSRRRSWDRSGRAPRRPPRPRPARRRPAARCGARSWGRLRRRRDRRGVGLRVRRRGP